MIWAELKLLSLTRINVWRPSGSGGTNVIPSALSGSFMMKVFTSVKLVTGFIQSETTQKAARTKRAAEGVHLSLVDPQALHSCKTVAEGI